MILVTHIEIFRFFLIMNVNNLRTDALTQKYSGQKNNSMDTSRKSLLIFFKKPRGH